MSEIQSNKEQEVKEIINNDSSIDNPLSINELKEIKKVFNGEVQKTRSDTWKQLQELLVETLKEIRLSTIVNKDGIDIGDKGEYTVEDTLRGGDKTNTIGYHNHAKNFKGEAVDGFVGKRTLSTIDQLIKKLEDKKEELQPTMLGAPLQETQSVLPQPVMTQSSSMAEKAAAETVANTAAENVVLETDPKAVEEKTAEKLKAEGDAAEMVANTAAENVVLETDPKAVEEKTAEKLKAEGDAAEMVAKAAAENVVPETDPKAVEEKTAEKLKAEGDAPETIAKAAAENVVPETDPKTVEGKTAEKLKAEQAAVDRLEKPKESEELDYFTLISLLNISINSIQLLYAENGVLRTEPVSKEDYYKITGINIISYPNFYDKYVDTFNEGKEIFI